jgi:hypothetical protein
VAVAVLVGLIVGLVFDLAVGTKRGPTCQSPQSWRLGPAAIRRALAAETPLRTPGRVAACRSRRQGARRNLSSSIASMCPLGAAVPDRKHASADDRNRPGPAGLVATGLATRRSVGRRPPDERSATKAIARSRPARTSATATRRSSPIAAAGERFATKAIARSRPARTSATGTNGSPSRDRLARNPRSLCDASGSHRHRGQSARTRSLRKAGDRRAAFPFPRASACSAVAGAANLRRRARRLSPARRLAHS